MLSTSYIPRFPSNILAGGSVALLQPVWALSIVLLTPFCWFFLQLQLFPHILVVNSTEDSRGLCRSLELSFMRLSPLRSSSLGALTSLVSPDSWLCLLNSVRRQGSAWVPPPCAATWKLSLDSKLGQLQGSFNLSPSPRNHCIVLPVVHCLKTVVSCISLCPPSPTPPVTLTLPAVV